MLEQLKQDVYNANMDLVVHGLVILTWGNASAIDRESGLVVIKPSGVAYDQMAPDQMVVVDLNGNVIDGDLNPSSDTPSHLALYRSFPDIGGVTHTHSAWATSCAQAGVPVTPLGTTQADYFHKSVPITRDMTTEEINGDYERHTGLCVVEAILNITDDALEVPAALVKNHGPFTWGRTVADAVLHAVVLEESAKLFVLTKLINLAAPPVSPVLLDRHFYRKHGSGAYYGQK